MDEIMQIILEMLDHRRHNQDDMLLAKAMWLPVALQEEKNNGQNKAAKK